MTFKKILIINIFGIGDVLFTTPLLANIKKHKPDCFIGYVGNLRTEPLLKNNPHINKVFTYERDEFYKLFQESKFKFLKKMFGMLGCIRKERFDVVLDLSLNSSVDFLTAFSGIKHRIGFNYKNRSPFLTKKIPLKGYEGRHVVDYYLDLLKELNIPADSSRLEVYLNDSDHIFAKDALKNINVQPNNRIVALIPGGGASWGKEALHKRWPLEKYAQLADKIIEKSKCQVILLGSQNEKELPVAVGRMMAQKPSGIFTEMAIGQFVAMLKNCQLVVTNDGGPLHMAVAAGVRTVSIFGPVDERVYGPYPKENHLVAKKDLPCQPCYRRFRLAACEHRNCLNTLTVNDVFEKVEKGLF